ncbi:hypothetical protein LS73_002925 [Helicobacter muridarum]|uniref:Uncharacterized protein n=1 Tax=Helicobacter muridarum TaxID=216 RepID=A0A099U0C3_9HELI|nr:hypothetical protein [Helicobacter muridarum]TLE00870.1 hypothetical protein LS73_002925 [Helicobacter muridarum]STQ86642.1 Uncharacterised protein [Helicobacter muridarum]
MKSKDTNSLYNGFITTIKICKHEFLLSRSLVIITIISTALNILLILLNNTPIKEQETLIGIIILLQFFTLGTFVVAYYFSSAISFYHGLFGRNAYLTHSLPVSLNVILISKISIFMLWACVGCIELLLFLACIDKIFYDKLLTNWIISISYAKATSQYSNMGEFFSYLSLYYFLLALSELTLIFMVAAIVHRIKSYTMIYGIIVFFIIQAIAFSFIGAVTEITSNIKQIAIECVMLMTLSLIYYFICQWIIKNKLSL